MNTEKKPAETLVASPTLDRLRRPLHDLRISVIDNCNLRCTYCMPLEKYGERYQFLSQNELLSFDEIVRIASAFSQLGVTKLRLTGGEPLLRKDLADLVRRLAGLEAINDIALTTNGLLLRKHAKALREAGLTRVTVSLDSMDESIAGRMNGRGLGPAPVLEGIQAAQDVGFSPIKINVTVMNGVNDAGLVDLARYFKDRDCIVRFIEYMDVGNRNGWKRDRVAPSKEIHDAIHAEHPLEPLEKNYHGEVASRYAYTDGSGEIGFISSVTTPFCRSCTRARISADGHLFLCLFAGEGTDLKALLHGGLSDEELVARLAGLWTNRDDRYSELRSEMSEWDLRKRKVEMYEIGG